VGCIPQHSSRLGRASASLVSTWLPASFGVHIAVTSRIKLSAQLYVGASLADAPFFDRYPRSSIPPHFIQRGGDARLKSDFFTVVHLRQSRHRAGQVVLRRRFFLLGWLVSNHVLYRCLACASPLKVLIHLLLCHVLYLL